MSGKEIDSQFDYNDCYYMHYPATDFDGNGYEYRMVCSRLERRKTSEKRWAFVEDADWARMTSLELRQIANILEFAAAGAHHPGRGEAVRKAANCG